MPPELLENPELQKALDIVEESAYTEGELYAYDKYWDAVRTEKTLFFGKWEEGKAEGLAEGEAKGLAEGKAEGEHQKQIEITRKAKQMGMNISDITLLTSLTKKELQTL